ncbi:MAG: serine hydrolase domain-containing protein, partial [Acidobacteriota bacterium]
MFNFTKAHWLAFLALAAPPGAAASEDQGGTIAGLQEATPRLMQQADIPGLQIALIQDGKVVWNQAFGQADKAGKVEASQETLFPAASLSKPVFAYAVLKLAEQGKIDLDQPISQYLPGYIEEDARIDAITARHVLSHSCGFPNWRPRGGKLKILFQPGERFSYSGEGYVYLQNAVERITAKPMDDFVREMVFDPLGMKDSSYVWQERFEGRTARGHDAQGKTHRLRKRTVANAAASLYTTSADYARFVTAVLNGEGLNRETWDDMLTSQVPVGRRNDFRAAQKLSWGLGWGLQEGDGDTAFWHWGDNGDFKCYVVAWRGRKSGLVYFTNSENGLSIPREILQAGLGEVHPALSWLSYEPYNGPSRVFMKQLDQGQEAALQSLRELRAGGRLKERWINGLGYRLLGQSKLDEAIGVFQLNCQAFPESFNV